MNYRIVVFQLLAVFVWSCGAEKMPIQDHFPDGTPITDWFRDTTRVSIAELGTPYILSDYGVGPYDTTVLHTEMIQQLIDEASSNGGGVVVIPPGVYYSGALFFKPGTHLHLQQGAVLKGSNDITHYPKQPSRMEGQNLDYFPALINAYGVDGFTISGQGVVDGNGLKFWKAFWARRAENPACTNLEVSRPRLVFIWDSDDVQLQDVTLQNSGFWTTHLYQCENVKVLGVRILAPRSPVKAPSTDAIDIDVCKNVLIRNCYMSVNDDAVALKGGKGPWADEDPNNGPNENILIENNVYGFCHSTFTCGSENIHTRNVLMRNCTVEGAQRLIYLKMRPDTPQRYEYITLEQISGSVHTGIYIKPWTQFFDLKGRQSPPVSTSANLTFRKLNLQTQKFADVGITAHDQLQSFQLEDCEFTSGAAALDTALFDGLTLSNVVINGQRWEGGAIQASEDQQETLQVFE
ncbi:rhamnogalacturonidase [Marinoscillum furvescens]|uniref:Glycosyl hydrolase family 28 n=1 Tax=Marinoscillum furvescens DSM 4134 TaxID=1122208 RepID=A0A3D9LFS8_MARFU|nr:glycosyl hydrolase family 28 protein [Marinoscillum furvescens]REE05520.1 glycosyl hydrolase family 28 [Marinoscillum furvescens DSM 4134]